VVDAMMNSAANKEMKQKHLDLSLKLWMNIGQCS
jgi:hypothetical protein